MSKQFTINPRLDDFAKSKASGWQQGTEIAVEQFVAHVKSMK